MSLSKHSIGAIVFAVCALFLAASAHAQYRASIQGVVTDPQGAVVSGADADSGSAPVKGLVAAELAAVSPVGRVAEPGGSEEDTPLAPLNRKLPPGCSFGGGRRAVAIALPF